MPRKILVHPEEAGLAIPADRADRDIPTDRILRFNSRSIDLPLQQVANAAMSRRDHIETTTCPSLVSTCRAVVARSDLRAPYDEDARSPAKRFP